MLRTLQISITNFLSRFRRYWLFLSVASIGLYGVYLFGVVTSLNSKALKDAKDLGKFYSDGLAQNISAQMEGELKKLEGFVRSLGYPRDTLLWKSAVEQSVKSQLLLNPSEYKSAAISWEQKLNSRYRCVWHFEGQDSVAEKCETVSSLSANEFYHSIRKTKDPLITAPYQETVYHRSEDSVYVISLAYPIFGQDSSFLGLLVIDYEVETFYSKLLSGDNRHISLLTQNQDGAFILIRKEKGIQEFSEEKLRISQIFPIPEGRDLPFLTNEDEQSLSWKDSTLIIRSLPVSYDSYEEIKSWVISPFADRRDASIFYTVPLATLLLLLIIYFLSGEARKYQRQLETLERLSAFILQSQNEREIIHEVYQRVNQFMDAPILIIGTDTPDGKVLEFPFLIEEGKLLHELRDTPSEPIFQIELQAEANRFFPSVICFRDQKTLNIPDYPSYASNFSELQKAPAGKLPGSAVFIPLTAENGKKLGIISAQSYKTRNFTSDHISFLKKIGTITLLAIEKILIIDQKEAALKDRTLALRNTESILKEKNSIMQDRDLIYGTIAHHIRGIYGPIKNAWKRLQQKQTNQEEQLAVIVDQTEKVKNFVDNITVWLQSEIKSIPFRPRRVDLSFIVTKVLETYGHNADEKNLILLNEIPPATLVLADPMFVEIIIGNLIHNAIKYSPENSKIQIYTKIEGENLLLSVLDQGKGLSKEEIQKIFDLNRVERIGTESSKGTGLGLYVSKRLLEKMGSEFQIQSMPGEGSCFSFPLPVTLQNLNSKL